MTEAAFAPHAPQEAQHTIPVEDFVAILTDLKPRFIHHPRCKELIREVLDSVQCDLNDIHFDVPRLRTATSGGYLNSGIAYAFKPHRDTWYSPPMCQLNWWLPIYDIASENCLAFHPRYWSRAVKNGSRDYNYYAWNAQSRANAASHIKSDTRKQPHAEEPLELEPQVRVVCPAGGLIIFSAAQMHSTVPNTTHETRFSLDFRTVHFDDARDVTGARNVDSASTGTVLRDFLRASDLTRLPAEVVALYDDDTQKDGDGVLVFNPTTPAGARA
jgi:ectoine hydroxylase-related dioxygenase (phytanoyl-CoA dioxygenase family)